MANPIKDLQVALRGDNARVVTWSLEPQYNYPESFTLALECSRAGGEWEELDPDVSGQCCYVDARRRDRGKRMDEYYRLKLTVSAAETYVSDAVAAGVTKVYPFSTEARNAITQIEQAIKLSGVTGVLLKRKVYGERCPKCTDFAGQDSVNEHCPVCLGTGFVGGYYPGIQLNIIKDSIQTAEGPSQIGFGQTEAVKARCVAYPWIAPGDVWCEDGTNFRYRVSGCSPASSYKTVPLVYTLALSRIEYTDVLHTKPATDAAESTEAWKQPESTGWAEAFDQEVF